MTDGMKGEMKRTYEVSLFLLTPTKSPMFKLPHQPPSYTICAMEWDDVEERGRDGVA